MPRPPSDYRTSPIIPYRHRNTPRASTANHPDVLNTPTAYRISHRIPPDPYRIRQCHIERTHTVPPHPWPPPVHSRTATLNAPRPFTAYGIPSVRTAYMFFSYCPAASHVSASVSACVHHTPCCPYITRAPPNIYHLQWYCIPSAPRYNPPDMSHLQWYTMIPSTMVHKCTGYCGTHLLSHPGISHRTSTIYGGTHMSHLQWYTFLTADSGQGRIKYQLQWYSVIPSTVVHKCTVYGGTHLPLYPDISRVKCTIYGGT